MKCFFCDETVSVKPSPLDVKGQPPDIHRAVCPNPECLWYDFVGTLKATAPDLKERDDLRIAIRKAHEEEVPIILDCFGEADVTLWMPATPF